MKDLLQLASAHAKVPLELIYKSAFEYYEVRISARKKYLLFMEYLHRDKIPPCVQDYCLEILTNRTYHEASRPRLLS